MSRTAYELTKLAFADVVLYRRLLEDLKNERVFRRISYQFCRDAIQAYHRSEGDIDVLENSIANARQMEDDAQDPSEAIQPRNNAEIIESYLTHFAVPFRPHAFDLPPEFSSYEIEIGGLRITGKPHMAVQNQRGSTKFIYILSSKDWSDQEKALFISLLGEIVAHNVAGAHPRDVEGLDCRNGTRIVRAGLGRNYRNRLEFLAEDLLRLGLA